METPKNNNPPKAQDEDATLLAFDRNSPTAAVDVYTDNSQQLTSSLERQFDKTAAFRGTDAAPRQEHGVDGHAKGASGALSHVEHQGQSAQSSSTGQGLGHGR